MCKEKILEILENAKDGNGAVPMRLVRTAFDKLPEPCEDTISRQATIDAVNNAFDRETLLTGFVRSIAVRVIRNMPPAQLEQKTATWLIRKWGDDAKCSNCGHTFKDVYDMDNYDRFCRFCGRKMVGIKGERDGD